MPQKPCELSTGVYEIAPVYLVGSVKPKSYSPAAWYLRFATTMGDASDAATLEKNVFWDCGLTVLMVSNARPTRPSVAVSRWN